MRCWLLLPVLTMIAASTVAAKTIKVPADRPTIQDAINSAGNGDIVLVSPGTYTENINFSGKAITVTSSDGPDSTIIDGGNTAPVAMFVSGEGPKSVLSYLTLQDGSSTFNTQYDGGGIYILDTSPTIAHNIIQKNSACNGGAGIAVSAGSPVIKDNIIKNNSQKNCSGGVGGGGIEVSGPGSAQIIGNAIHNNVWPGNGGGITLFGGNNPTIMNNVIRENSSENGQGGGMWIVNTTDTVIVQNLFYGNTGSQGGAVYLSVPNSTGTLVLVNNTIIGGPGTAEGSALWVGGFDSFLQFYNNLMIGLAGQNAVDCDATYSSQPPTFTNNDAYSSGGTGLEGTCAGQSNENGNISLNPLFLNPKHAGYQLRSDSPAINAGDVSAPDLPEKDLDGNPRIVNGTVDIGAYESK
jgi:hypothetical protein